MSTPSTITSIPATSPPSGSTTSAPGVTSTTSTTTVPTVTCQSAQLQASLGGVQGATGNLAAAFWIADTSGTPCALRSGVTVDLVDGSGTIRMSASKVLTAPIALGAHGVLPSSPFVVQPGQSFGLAFVSLFWPTTSELAGSTDGRCRRPIFVPTTVRISFGGLAQVLVEHPEVDGQTIAICPSRIWIEAVGPL